MLLRELVLYGVIGCGSTMLDFSLYAFLVGCLNVHYQIANILSVAVSLSNGFLWNYFANFNVRGRFWARFAGFYAVGMFGWVIGACQLWLFVEVLEWNQFVAKVAAVVICTAVQFVLNKFLTFRKIPEVLT